MPRLNARLGRLVGRRLVMLCVALGVFVVVLIAADAWLPPAVRWAGEFSRFQLGDEAIAYVQGLGAIGIAMAASGIAARLTASPLTRPRVGSPLPPAASVRVVRTLRADIATFTGRGEQIQEIVQAITTNDAGAGGLVTIYAINGMPGVGKTALAVHIGHLVADQFPDGQLFVDLRAHSVDHGPADPAHILATLLSATGMAPEQIPDGEKERAAGWRDRTAGKRLLLLLDNAAGDEQVKPLLPGSAGCLVLVTSRRRLAGLGRDYGATILPLGVLPEPDAVALLTRVFPHSLTAEDQAAAAELVRLCGYLPLAITIVAAGIDPDERTSIADLRTDLDSAQNRLVGIDAHLDGEELGVAAAFDLSYQRLPSDQQQALRLLSVTPGADVDPFAAAALTDLPLELVRVHLRALRTHRLIERPAHDRYRLHDLIAVYVHARTSFEERDQALARLLDYYQRTAAMAAAAISRYSARPVRTESPGPSPALSNQVLATQWLRAERANLFACLQHNRRYHEHTRLVELTASLATFLEQDGPRAERIELRTHALAICREIGDRHGEAWILSEVGAGRNMTGGFPEAVDLQQQALTIFRKLGDRHGEAYALLERGSLHRGSGDYRQAAGLLKQALAIFRKIGHRPGEVRALGELGAVRGMTGDYPQAVSLLDQALVISREIGNRGDEAWDLSGLGTIERLTGDYPQATSLLEQALIISREIGDRKVECGALGDLGVLHRLTGDYPRAAELLEQALNLAREIGDLGGDAWILAELGVLRRLTGDYAQATDLLERALTHCRDGDPTVEPIALGELGALRRMTGDYPQAAALLDRALSIFRKLGDRAGEAEILNHQGALLLSSGDPRTAREHHRHALELARKLATPLEEARALAGAGRCAMAMRIAEGRADLRNALEIFGRIGAAEAVDLTAEVAGMPPSHY